MLFDSNLTFNNVQMHLILVQSQYASTQLACFNLIGLEGWPDGGACRLICKLACIDIT